MKNLYSIGEMEKITGVPVSTLRYYDEIGLIEAEKTDAKTGYRYYAYEQTGLVEMVQVLKNLGVKLDEIKAIVAGRDEKTFYEAIDRQKAKLQNQQRQIMQKLGQVQYIDKIRKNDQFVKNPHKISQHTIGHRRVLMKELGEAGGRDQVRKEFRKMQKQLSKPYQFSRTGQGFLLAEDSFVEKQVAYTGEFIQVPEIADEDQDYIYILPSGEYICVTVPLFLPHLWMAQLIRYMQVRDLRPRSVIAVHTAENYFHTEKALYQLQILI